MKKENHHLIELWRKAMSLKKDKKWESAAEVFEEILDAQPDWEHGYGHFNLAECYEESGKIKDAYSAYQKATKCMSTDRTLLGGFASFLYLYGDANDAFNQYNRLLSLEKKAGDSESAVATIQALKSLGIRLGMSKEDIDFFINNPIGSAK